MIGWRWVLLLGVALVFGGYRWGLQVATVQCAADRAADQVVVHQQIEAQTARIAAVEQSRLAAEADSLVLQLALEDAAHADPVSNECGLPIGRVLRIDQR